VFAVRFALAEEESSASMPKGPPNAGMHSAANAPDQGVTRQRRSATLSPHDREDDEAFELVKSQRSGSAYRRYINNYPSGRHVPEVRARLAMCTTVSTAVPVSDATPLEDHELGYSKDDDTDACNRANQRAHDFFQTNCIGGRVQQEDFSDRSITEHVTGSYSCRLHATAQCVVVTQQSRETETCP